MSDPLAISSRRELFVDRYLIDRLSDAVLKLHEPVRREVVFQVREPLENACTFYYNLTQDGDRILLYYRGYYPIGANAADRDGSQTANLIVSEDGIHFERPEIGLYALHGSTANNIVRQGNEGHNFCVFRDGNPATPPEQRFKAVGGVGHNNLRGFFSADGLRWASVRPGPLAIEGAFDSLNTPFWDPIIGKYRLFSRYFEGGSDGSGVRAIQSCVSDDFIHWTAPTPHHYEPGVPLEHFYTNATTLCPGAEHLLLSFPMRFVPERTRNTEGMDYPGEGLSDAVFMTSRDGIHWDRTFLDAWLRPGPDQRNWTHRNVTPSVGLVTAPDEWSLYVCEHYGWSTNRLRRVTVRPYGFASVHAGYQVGELVTKPLCFTGNTLFLNLATSAVGSIAVEVQEPDGRPIPGFSLDEATPIFGDSLDEPVGWRGGASLGTLAGRSVRFRFALKDADLFALRTG